MQEKHLFEYAVIRIVPRVEREEFLNIGVIVYCAHEKFLQVEYCINKQKLDAFTSTIDCSELEKKLMAIKQICNGEKEGGDIAALPIASRFRWLTAAKSTILQTSSVHPGLCVNAAGELNKLYDKLVC